jgi:hypothetical protein
MAIDGHLRIRVPPDVLFQEVGGETVLLDLGSEEYFGLDAVGTRVWQLLSGGASVGQAIDALLEEYDVEREVLEGDVERLIGDLVAAGLVVPAQE